MAYAIDLFCGAGGCSEGLIQAGFHILFSSDISDMVEVTYKHRHEQLGLIQGKNTCPDNRYSNAESKAVRSVACSGSMMDFSFAISATWNSST